MRVHLLCENIGFDDIQFDVSDNSLVLGRSLKADVRVVHPLVSRLHCEWRLVNGDVVVRDLESTNHTLINGEPIQQSVLHSGDRVLLGDVLYIVEILDNSPNGLVAQPEGTDEQAENSTPRFGMENASWQSKDR
jgi:pSer/pThr/pTyr-binding forkhead associated (FHA) protein